MDHPMPAEAATDIGADDDRMPMTSLDGWISLTVLLASAVISMTIGLLIFGYY